MSDHERLIIPPRPPMPQATTSEPARAWRRDPRAWLIVYVAVLAAIILWPVPVDSGAQGLLRTISRFLPFLTYGRIEFTANIALFVPLGFLLTCLIARERWLILPIAVVTTVAAEWMQAVFLPARTPSALDVAANLAGACIGMLVAVAREHRSR
ncbi:VanZ family protein [uncultured Microbacterium sp.]|uniref:VanZ family protein n=1 Tax=uncultured Microbacterium sp. TaxID=191216 RepID=UPI0026242138|nr:VanZ family protein [uncultured Microbacterium sp.]